MSLATAALSTAGATAQVRFEGPQFGYLFDDVSKSVRALGGVPGAASLEDRIPAEFSVDRAVVSQRGFALVQSKGGGDVYRLSPAGSRRMASADLWQVSPSGAFAVLYSKGAGKAAVWDLNADEPSLKAEFASPELTSVAVADDGTAAGIAGSSVIEISASGARAIASGGELASIAYFPGSRDLAFADLAGRVVVSRSGATIEHDAAVRGALAISRDGQRVVVAANDGVWIWNLAAQEGSFLSCGCSVNEIRSVGRADVYHLASADTEYPILLDLTTSEPRLARVPVASVQAAAAKTAPADGGVK